MAYTKANEEVHWGRLRLIIEEKSFAISIITCHHFSKKVLKHQVVLKQGGNSIQPKAISQHEGSSGGDQIIVYFFFDQIDPKKAATLVGFEDSGQEFEHKLDFSLMP